MNTQPLPKRPSLAAAPFRAAILVILTMAGILGLFWAYDEYLNYRFTVDSIRARYLKQYQDRLVEEMESVIDFVDYRKSQTDQLIEEELVDKVQTAYITAAHLYSLYKDKISQQELRTMIIEAIRPLRWDTGRGYYFIVRTADGVVELNADMPELEKTSQLDLVNVDGDHVILGMIDIATKRGAGLYRYRWQKPGKTGHSFPKVVFVKSFEPFGWFIGTGIYEDDMNARIRQDIIGRLKNIHFSASGTVNCFTGEGVTLADFEPKRSGRLVSAIVDARNRPIGREFLDIARSEDGEGFVEYHRFRTEKGDPVPRLAYVRTFPAWDWVFVTGIDMDEMEETIVRESDRHLNIVYRDIAVFVFLLLIAISIVAVIAYYHSQRTRHGIELFTDFFRDAADHKIKLDDMDFQYQEFAILGEFANRMVDEKIEKEQMIRADRLRLDALLRLSEMTGASQKEVCDLILGRMLEITGSERGYIALPSSDEAVVSLQSFLEADGSEWSKEDSEISRFADKAGYPGTALRQRSAVICNAVDDAAGSVVYPVAKGPVRNHIDVPIVDGERVPLIAGVCNKRGDYSDFDVGQLRLLLEGMRHHFLKNSSEREMLRLRNLLKGINDSMPSILIGVDMNGRVMQWNREAERLTGIAATDAEGLLLSQVFPRLSGYLVRVQEVIESGIPAVEQRVPYADNGETRYESITVYPLVAQHVTGAVIRIDDVTEKVRIEDLMIQSEKMLSVGGLAAGMAHEINNPLAGILQNLQVVQNRLSPALPKNSEVAATFDIRMEDVEAYMKARGVDAMFRAISDSAKRAAQLVQNMLSFSRKSDSSFTSQDIRRLMDDTLVLAANDYDLKKKYDFRKIEIRKEYGSDIPAVPCEVTNIQQVFLNILRNAAYALSEREWVDEAPRLTIRIAGEEQAVRIEIADNGPGMAENIRKRIFEPFFTTKPVGLGTGLGMSISYFIIHDQHKGTIEVNSMPGQGATFIIRLPCRRS